MDQISRRDFVTMTAAVAAGCIACGGFCEMAGAAEDGATGGTVDAGPIADFAKDGIYDKFAKSHKLLVIRNEGQLYACSAVCTHKKASLTVQGQEILCKKHGSRFSPHGTPTKGPAKVSLPRYAVSVDDRRHVLIDTATQFPEKEWDKPGASVKA